MAEMDPSPRTPAIERFPEPQSSRSKVADDAADTVDWKTLDRLDHQEDAGTPSSPEKRNKSKRESELLRHRLSLSSSSIAADLGLEEGGQVSRRQSVRDARKSLQDAQKRASRRRSLRSTIISHQRGDSTNPDCLLTDLELWTALVADYTSTAARLPTLTTRKIRRGIPDPLRGLVWQAILGARDTNLEGLYERLSEERNGPFESVIERDLTRTFPQVEMFRREGGEGQTDLGRVLRSYAIYDAEVGYCQGLGFLAALLLLNMSDCEAFCCLVRIMEGHGLRNMFLPTLAGLKLRLFQFEKLLQIHAPDVAAYLESIEVRPAIYVSQWFLSIFGVAAPLDTLHRLYDVVLAEGASETIMRVALALLIKNKDKILHHDMEEVMRLLLGSELWSAYDGNTDGLVQDAVAYTPSVTTEVLAEFERQFEEQQKLSGASLHPHRHVSNASVSGLKGFGTVAASLLTKINTSRIFSGTYSHASNPSTAAASPAITSASTATGSKGSASTAGERASTDASSRATMDSLQLKPAVEREHTPTPSVSFARAIEEIGATRSTAAEAETPMANDQVANLLAALTETTKERDAATARADADADRLARFQLLVEELFAALAMSSDAPPQDTGSADGDDTSPPPTRQQCINHWCVQLQHELKNDTDDEAAAEAEHLTQPSSGARVRWQRTERALMQKTIECQHSARRQVDLRTDLQRERRERERLERQLKELTRNPSGSISSRQDLALVSKVANGGGPVSAPVAGAQAQMRAPLLKFNGRRSPSPCAALTTAPATRNSAASIDSTRNGNSNSNGSRHVSEPSSPSVTSPSAHDAELDALRVELSQTKARLALAMGEAEEARFLLSKHRSAASVGTSSGAAAAAGAMGGGGRMVHPAIKAVRGDRNFVTLQRTESAPGGSVVPQNPLGLASATTGHTTGSIAAAAVVEEEDGETQEFDVVTATASLAPVSKVGAPARLDLSATTGAIDAMSLSAGHAGETMPKTPTTATSTNSAPAGSSAGWFSGWGGRKA